MVEAGIVAVAMKSLISVGNGCCCCCSVEAVDGLLEQDADVEGDDDGVVTSEEADACYQLTLDRDSSLMLPDM